jgi:flagellin
MAIDGISGASYQANLVNSLSSGNRISSASNDPAGLAIAGKMEAEIRGIGQGIDNTMDMQNLLRTAEGGLSAINDGLQRVRELNVQAANGIMTASDRRIIQFEIDQVMQGISQTAQNTQFNNINLLNGSARNLHTASNSDGSGATVNLPDMNELAQVLLEGINVINNENAANNFNLIDNAMQQVNASRSEIGALYNRMDHTVNSLSVTLLNQAAAKSRIADTDMAKSIMEYTKQNILQDMQIQMQKQEMEQMRQGPLQLLL